MAPVTRSKATKAGKGSPKKEPKPGVNTEKAASKPEKTKRHSKPKNSGSKTKTSKVQKKKKKAPKPKRKARQESPKSQRTRSPRPADASSNSDWELAESYRILPLLGDLNDETVFSGMLPPHVNTLMSAQPPGANSSASMSPGRRNQLFTTPALRAESDLRQSPKITPERQHGHPASRKASRTPATPKQPAANLIENGWLAPFVELRQRFPDDLEQAPIQPNAQQPPQGGYGKRRDSSIIRSIIADFTRDKAPQTDQRRSNREVGGIVGGAEAHARPGQPETRVSVNNAQVFKRPTVADLRQERAQMHDRLEEWVEKLKDASEMFYEVIDDVEERMAIIKAVNRMQAPLRKAPLGGSR